LKNISNFVESISSGQEGGYKNNNPEVCHRAGTAGSYDAKVVIFLVWAMIFAQK
jgi:hypothetical protein